MATHKRVGGKVFNNALVNRRVRNLNVIAIEINQRGGARSHLLNNTHELVYLNNIAYSKRPLNGKK